MTTLADSTTRRSRRTIAAWCCCTLALLLACHAESGSAPDESGDTTPQESSSGGDEVPATCCGCLCADERWSCSEDTCVTEDAEVLTLAPEAGFFELDGGPYVVGGMAQTAPRHRVWYAFRPADDAPEQRPIVMFFNGGPGSATAPLFAFNTNAMTLDPERTAGQDVAPNPASWTSFANVLYVDAPATGFSYPLPLVSGDEPPVTIDIERDAAAMTRVLLRFLAHHPTIRGNEVILVGESYGGTRASLMLAQLLDYPALLGGAYVDEALHDEIVAHLEATIAEGDTASPAAVAAQFGRQVLVQPLVAGLAQLPANPENPPDHCVATPDAYQCDQPSGWLEGVTAALTERMTRPTVLAEALGVDPSTIAWMHADARAGAYGRGGGASQPEMAAMFGELGDEDAYYVGFNGEVSGQLPGSRDWLDPSIGEVFLRNLAQVDTFITDAPYDLAVVSANLADALQSATDMAAAVTHDSAPRSGVARPGWLQIDFVPGAVAVDHAEIRFPRYPTAGHMVTLREPAELLADVRAWYDGT